MSFVIQNDLADFKAKLKSFNASKIQEKVVEQIAKKGVEIATNEYSGTSVTVSQETNKNKVSIIAKGKNVTFIEFGTGLTGKGTYPEDKLPKSGIPITGSWIYYYPSVHKKTVNGKQGWFFGKTFTTGLRAGQYMYNTSKAITEYCKNELKEDIRSGV